MHSQHPSSRAPSPAPTVRQPTPVPARTAGLYGEVVAVPVATRSLAAPLERKTFA